MDANNVIAGTHSYDAFGNGVMAFGKDPTTTMQKHLYVGESYDPDTGYYHLRAREYDPHKGRPL